MNESSRDAFSRNDFCKSNLGRETKPQSLSLGAIIGEDPPCGAGVNAPEIVTTDRAPGGQVSKYHYQSAGAAIVYHSAQRTARRGAHPIFFSQKRILGLPDNFGAHSLRANL